MPRPRIGLSFFFLLILIAALATQNWMLNRKLETTTVLLPGDTLALQIRGVLDGDDRPSTEVADATGTRAVEGWPITILEDGFTSLPTIGRIELAGLTIDEARSVIASSYSETGTQIDDSDVEIEPVIKKRS